MRKNHTITLQIWGAKEITKMIESVSSISGLMGDLKLSRDEGMAAIAFIVAETAHLQKIPLETYLDTFAINVRNMYEGVIMRIEEMRKNSNQN